ncbi:MAG: HEAT repeat domain-containing protein [Leucobacter sp.]
MASIDRALAVPDPSARLQAALVAGTSPDPAHLPALIARCGEEPDFFVRDMLTWAIARYPAGASVPRLQAALDSPVPQARAQARRSPGVSSRSSAGSEVAHPHAPIRWSVSGVDAGSNP